MFFNEKLSHVLLLLFRAKTFLILGGKILKEKQLSKITVMWQLVFSIREQLVLGQ